MDDSLQGSGYRHGLGILPDISAQVYANSSFLHAIIDKFKHLQLGLRI